MQTKREGASKVSKMSDYMHSFLESGGYDLGYSELDLPDLEDMEDVIKKGITVWKYYKVTERQYYAGKKVSR
tara:strand:+ start:5794 stop:6009 length:216 start_codon:yes stop_codon:yes gene_type:complete